MISLIRVTVRTNSMISWLRRLPVTRLLVTDEFHRYEWIKLLITIISWVREFARIFIYKILYYVIIFLQMSMIMERYEGGTPPFTHRQLLVFVMILFPVIGAVMNNEAFDLQEDTYHAIFTLRMPAREYMLSGFIYQSIKYLIGNLAVASVALCVFGGLPFYMVFCYVIYGAALKWIFTGFEVWYRSRHIGDRSCNRVMSIVKVITVGIPVIAVIAALAVSGYVPVIPEITFSVLAAVTLIIAVPAGLFLVHYGDYRMLFKTFLTPEMIISNREARQHAESQVVRESMSKAISGHASGGDLMNRKSGYDLFNAIFFKRHSKIIMRPVLVTAGLALGAVLVLMYLIFTEPESVKAISFGLYEYTGFLLFVMYAINTGKRTSEAMFVNCDSSMLMYRFYRVPKTLLSVFAGRLRRIVLINLIPAVVIAGGVALLAAVTGEGAAADVILYPLAVIMLSLFFSTHNIVLYYLLQPFTADSSIKNPLYKFVHMITYVLCLFAMIYMKGTPAVVFFGICAGIALVYIPAALFAVYKLAPVTFKIRM